MKPARQTCSYDQRPVTTKGLRYHAALEQARAEAAGASCDLCRLLAGPATLEQIAAVSRKAQMAAARLCTAAADILSPP